MICPKCKKDKEVGGFSKNKARKSGLQVYCVPCMRVSIKKSNETEGAVQKRRAYQKTERYKKYQKKYQAKYEKTEKRRLYKARYRGLERTKVLTRKNKREYQAKRRKSDFRFRLESNMGSAISVALKGNKGRRHWESLVDYSLGELVVHLEKRFDEKMSWDNYGSYWSVDHIKPKAAFSYESPEDESFKVCWSLDNLQPLEKIENIIKSDAFEDF